MSAETIDYSQEPKKIFTAFLIKYMSLAFYYIFVLIGQQSKGLEIIDGVISSLGEFHQNALKKEHDLIRRGSMRGGAKVDAREMYQTVSRYLNKTYYEECNIGIIPTSTVAGDQEAPSHKIEERVSARI